MKMLFFILITCLMFALPTKAQTPIQLKYGAHANNVLFDSLDLTTIAGTDTSKTFYMPDDGVLSWSIQTIQTDAVTGANVGIYLYVANEDTPGAYGLISDSLTMEISQATQSKAFYGYKFPFRYGKYLIKPNGCTAGSVSVIAKPLK